MRKSPGKHNSPAAGKKPRVPSSRKNTYYQAACDFLNRVQNRIQEITSTCRTCGPAEISATIYLFRKRSAFRSSNRIPGFYRYHCSLSRVPGFAGKTGKDFLPLQIRVQPNFPAGKNFPFRVCRQVEGSQASFQPTTSFSKVRGSWSGPIF